MVSYGQADGYYHRKQQMKLLTNSEDPNETAPKEQSNLGLHCFLIFQNQTYTECIDLQTLNQQNLFAF